jgi:hypothetical protein
MAVQRPEHAHVTDHPDTVTFQTRPSQQDVVHRELRPGTGKGASTDAGPQLSDSRPAAGRAPPPPPTSRPTQTHTTRPPPTKKAQAQIGIDQFVQKGKIERLNSHLAKWIFTSGISFNSLKNPHFQDFVHKCCLFTKFFRKFDRWTTINTIKL